MVPRSRTAAKTSVTAHVAGIDDEFRADLGAGDQILVGDLVDDVAHEHRAGSEEQVDGINEVPGDVVVGDVATTGTRSTSGWRGGRCGARRGPSCGRTGVRAAGRPSACRRGSGTPASRRVASGRRGRLVGSTRSGPITTMWPTPSRESC